MQGSPYISKCAHIQYLNITTKCFQGVPPLISLCHLGRHNHPVVPITQSTFFLVSFFSFWVLPLYEEGLLVLLLLYILWFLKSLEWSHQNQLKLSELWNILKFQCCMISKAPWKMWDSLKPDWNRTCMMWLEKKQIVLNISQIESKQKWVKSS